MDDGGAAGHEPQRPALGQLGQQVVVLSFSRSSRAASASWSVAWRNTILVWMSPSRPSATLAAAVPSSACARRSERRWVTRMFQIPHSRHSLRRACSVLGGAFGRRASPTPRLRRGCRGGPAAAERPSGPTASALVVSCTSGNASALSNTAERSTRSRCRASSRRARWTGRRTCRAACAPAGCTNAEPQGRQRGVQLGVGQQRQVLVAAQFIGQRPQHAGQVAAASLAPAAMGVVERADGDRQQRLLDDVEIAAERRSRSCRPAGFGGPAGSCSGSPGPGSSGLSRSVPPGISLTVGIPNAVGQGPVLAFGVGDGDEPSGAVVAGLTPQHRLDCRGLAVARLTEHQQVGVGEDRAATQIPAVQLEGVVAPRRAAIGDVDTDIGGGDVGQGVAAVERVDRRQMRRRAAVPRHSQPWISLLRRRSGPQRCPRRRRRRWAVVTGSSTAAPRGGGVAVVDSLRWCSAGGHAGTTRRASERPSGNEATHPAAC